MTVENTIEVVDAQTPFEPESKRLRQHDTIDVPTAATTPVEENNSHDLAAEEPSKEPETTEVHIAIPVDLTEDEAIEKPIADEEGQSETVQEEGCCDLSVEVTSGDAAISQEAVDEPTNTGCQVESQPESCAVEIPKLEECQEDEEPNPATE